MCDLLSRNIDLIVVGGGPAGLAAAISARKEGIKDLLIVERNNWLGGILPQCIHDGFGLIIFKETLTGPEYAQKYIDEVKKLEIPYIIDSMVLEITPEKDVIVSSPKGLLVFHAKAIILAMGCRERTRGQIRIPGSRPAGVYTAGVAQNLVNLKNFMVGKDIVVLGSGDIGLIMTRRLTFEGAKVHVVAEILPYPSGLPRNIQQCLIDYDVPLLLSHTVTEIQGQNRVEAVVVSQVDENSKPIEGTQQRIACDTLILSVGLIPENELSKTCGVDLNQITGGAVVKENLETSVQGIFACGNALHVHDVVDYVSLEAQKAGKSVAEYVLGKQRKVKRIQTEAGNGVRYVLPDFIRRNVDLELFMRVVCLGKDKHIGVFDGKKLVKKKKFRKIHPAEMIKMRLKGSETKNVKALRVEVLEK